MAKKVIDKPDTTTESINLDVNIDKSPTQTINEVLASLPKGDLAEPPTNFNTGAFIANEPLMPTDQSKNYAMMESLAAAIDAGTKSSPAHAQVLSALQTATTHREKISTLNTNVVVGQNVVQIPAAVRDLPNRLYRDSNNNPIREQADLIVEALFGKDDMAPTVFLWAAKRGFDLKPLVWISQQLFEYIELDKPVDFKGTIPFDAVLDENPESPIVHTLNRCFYHLTVKNLIRTAKEKNLSVIEILRSIFRQYDKDNQPIKKPGV